MIEKKNTLIDKPKEEGLVQISSSSNSTEVDTKSDYNKDGGDTKPKS